MHSNSHSPSVRPSFAVGEMKAPVYTYCPLPLVQSQGWHQVHPSLEAFANMDTLLKQK